MVTPYGSHPAINPDQFLDLSWEMFGELCRALALRVARQYDPDLVVGIARAGVIPGAVIASILRVDFHSMKISRRDGDEQVRERAGHPIRGSAGGARLPRPGGGRDRVLGRDAADGALLAPQRWPD